MHVPFWRYKNWDFPKTAQNAKKTRLPSCRGNPWAHPCSLDRYKSGALRRERGKLISVVHRHSGPWNRGTSGPFGHRSATSPPRGPPEHVLNRPNARTSIETAEFCLQSRLVGFLEELQKYDKNGRVNSEYCANMLLVCIRCISAFNEAFSCSRESTCGSREFIS